MREKSHIISHPLSGALASADRRLDNAALFFELGAAAYE
jgi:hypothetical protein